MGGLDRKMDVYRLSWRQILMIGVKTKHPPFVPAREGREQMKEVFRNLVPLAKAYSL